jgi:hypothetical protein
VQIARYFTDSELSCCNHVEKYNMRNIKNMQLARVTEANYGLQPSEKSLYDHQQRASFFG